MLYIKPRLEDLEKKYESNDKDDESRVKNSKKKVVEMNT